jgi:hypothetical protein
MKKLKTLRAFPALSVMLIGLLWGLLLSCDFGVSPGTGRESGFSGPAPGMGRLIITLDEGGIETPPSRSAIPSFNFTRYELFFLEQEGIYSHEGLSAREGSVELMPGTWTITARAYTGEDEDYTLTAVGSKTVDLSAGEVLSVAVPLSMILGDHGTGEETGSLSYFIEFPSGAYTSKTLTIYNIDDLQGTALAQVNLDSSPASGSIALAPNVYAAEVVLTNSAKRITSRYLTSVHVYAGKNTYFGYAFEASAFDALIPVTGSVAIKEGLAINFPRIEAYQDEACTRGAEASAMLETGGGFVLFVPSSLPKVWLRFEGEYTEKTVYGHISGPYTLGDVPINTAALPEERFYSISADTFNDGTVSAPPAGSAGASVPLSVDAAEGYGLAEGSLKVNGDGDGITGNSFVMPEESVVLSGAAFHSISVNNSDPHGDIGYEAEHLASGSVVKVKILRRDWGWRYGRGEIQYNGTPVDANLGFVMPASDVTLSAVFEQGFELGDRGPANGWIFYEASPEEKAEKGWSWNYMECAPEDLPAKHPWGYRASYINLALESTAIYRDGSIGMGKDVTQAIFNVLMFEEESVLLDSAAYNCIRYGTSHNGQNFNTGWFLPTQGELNELYVNVGAKGLGNFSNITGSNYYMSTTEIRRDSFKAYVYVRDLRSGGTNMYSMADECYVRPVRTLSYHP